MTIWVASQRVYCCLSVCASIYPPLLPSPWSTLIYVKCAAVKLSGKASTDNTRVPPVRRSSSWLQREAGRLCSSWTSYSYKKRCHVNAVFKYPLTTRTHFLLSDRSYITHLLDKINYFTNIAVVCTSLSTHITYYCLTIIYIIQVLLHIIFVITNVNYKNRKWSTFNNNKKTKICVQGVCIDWWVMSVLNCLMRNDGLWMTGTG